MQIQKPKILHGSAACLERNGGIRKPDYLMLNLPYACNYRCSKCCNSHPPKTKEPLALSEIFSLLSEARLLGARVLVVAGEGEPFLDGNIEAIVSFAHREGLIPYIFTNGSLVDRRMAGFLKNNGASLMVNVDSLAPGTYEKLSGVQGSFSRVMENICALREEFCPEIEEGPDYLMTRLAINTVLSRANSREVFPVQGEPMKDFCNSDFVLVYNLPIMRGNAGNEPGSFEVPQELLGRIQAGGVPLGTTSDGKQCAYMAKGIGADGEVLACAYSLGSAGKFGNVRNGGLGRYADVANAAARRFYGEHGHSRCIFRHPEYDAFVRG